MDKALLEKAPANVLFTTSNSDSEDDFLTPSLSKKVFPRQESLIEPVIRNPFVNIVNLGFRQKIKITLNGIFLMPIRIVCIVLLTVTAIGVGHLLTMGLTNEDLKREPVKGWRLKLRGVLRFLGRSIAFCFGFHHIRKNGRRATRQEAPILVAAPHSSMLDVFVFYVAGLPCGVSRDSNAKLPFMGNLLRSVQPILVTREDTQNKLATIDEIKRRADPNADWPQIMIFPEGTTTNRSCLITFKPGAFIPALPVQPIVVEYKNHIDCITWTWEGLSALKVMFLTLCQFNNKMEITYLPVYVPNEAEKLDPKLFARNVQKRMASYLNVMTTSHTYEDCRLMVRARQLHLPLDSALIEYDKIRGKLGTNYDECQKILEKFARIAQLSTGRVDVDDFAKYLELPPRGAVKYVFSLYDRDSNGFIDYREFLIGLCLIIRPITTEEFIKKAFEVLDVKRKGSVTLEALQALFYEAFLMKPDDVASLFKKIDTNNDDVITFDEFQEFVNNRPEYIKILLIYGELKIKPTDSSSAIASKAARTAAIKRAIAGGEKKQQQQQQQDSKQDEKKTSKKPEELKKAE